MQEPPIHRDSAASPAARLQLDGLMPEIYAELKRLAASFMARERAGHTLQATALLHEAYMRMAGQRKAEWQDHAHMMALFARMMRRVLLDYADQHQASKRGGELARVTLSDECALTRAGQVEMLDLDRALEELHQIDPQQAAVVELRFFAGMSDDQIGAALDCSPATVRRRWTSARLWLARALDGGQG